MPRHHSAMGFMIAEGQLLWHGPEKATEGRAIAADTKPDSTLAPRGKPAETSSQTSRLRAQAAIVWAPEGLAFREVWQPWMLEAHWNHGGCF